jgi:hypothetical protein
MTGISKLQDMVFDEISMVRRPANQYASIVFSKADEGAGMTVLYTEDGQETVLTTEDGQEIDIDDLEPGTMITLDDGQEFEVVEYDERDERDEDYPQTDEVEYEESDYGKSADYGELITKAYEEAVTDEAKAKLFATVAKSAQIAKEEAVSVRMSMEAMREQEYVDTCIAKADEYGFAGPRTDLLGVAIAKGMLVWDEDETALMDDIFKAFSSLIDEVALGTEGSGPSEVLDIVDGVAADIVKSTEGNLTTEQAFAAAFDANPDLYNLYLAEKEGR